MSELQREQIIRLLKEKSVVKQDIYLNTQNVFEELKKIVSDITIDLKREAGKIDGRIGVESKFTGDQEIELKVAGDVLVFYMHTNVFEFDKSHPMFKTGYIKENNYNSYCGIIYIYNFLADSFKYNRLNDLGYLIGRIFINREKKFFVEAKPPLGYKYNNFSKEPITTEILQEIVNDLIVYALSFDLFTPPADTVREITVNEIQERIQSDKLKTGKRLGFRFQSDSEIGDGNL
jgi:hypothetical protein